MRESRSPPPFNEEPQISKDFWGFFFFPRIFFFSAGGILHRFSSSGFFFIGFHGWIGRQSCLSDYSRISADIWPLANGSRQKWNPIVFVTQISQMTQIFSHWLFKSHRFHGFPQIFFIDYLSSTDFTDSHRFFHSLFFSWIYMDFLWFSSFSCHSFFFSVISLFRRF